MLITLLGESVVCSAMVAYFVSAPLQAHSREADTAGRGFSPKKKTMMGFSTRVHLLVR